MTAPYRGSVFWIAACITTRPVDWCIAIPWSGHFIHYVDMEKTRRDIVSFVEIP
jgi:hypothetical protein